MAGHIQDRWYKNEPGPDGKSRRARTERYGTGMRYRARYIAPDGTERSKSFPDRQKRQAEDWLRRIESDMSQGQYMDPKAASVTFQEYAETYVKNLSGDPNTKASMSSQLRLHAFPRIGLRQVTSFQPAHIREFVADLEASEMSGSYARVIFSNVRAVLTAAVDDGYLVRNPCQARTVNPPALGERRVVPWQPERVFTVRAALTERYRATVDAGAGCGLRQGEILGLSVEELDFENETLHVVHQLKLSLSKPVFAPPKRNKLRDVPLPRPVAEALKAHMERFPPVKVTLPWMRAGGAPVTRHLLFSGPSGGHVWRGTFNEDHWKQALVATGVIPARERGQRHQAARQHGMHALRHFYASVLLDAGESIKAVSEYLGHADPGMTLRVYAHLMPTSRERTRRALADVFEQRGLTSGAT